MRIFNPQTTQSLLPELRSLLARLRRQRGFDVERYIRAKGIVLNDYMRQSRLDACVVAVSGGVDSAVALGLVARAKSQADSPIQRIVAVMMPVFDPGATHQDEATERGREVALAFGVEPIVIDISAGHAALKSAVDTGMAVVGEPWASGQLVSYARTPALYYITSLLTQQGQSGILLGTTNRDEGGYLGFIGKASDAMVDIQLLSDLHKSEIYRVARALGAPASVLEATPTGDMYDGRVDEEVFGAPYDFVELYLLYKDLGSEEDCGALKKSWSREALEQFDFFAANLEALHRYNGHKYLGKSPAVHLDILHASTPGGWNNSLYLLHTEPPVNPARINGLFELGRLFFTSLRPALETDVICEPILDLGDSAFLLRHLFSAEEMQRLREEVLKQHWVPVAVNGMKQDFDPEVDPIGSWRATAYDPIFARMLWDRMKGYLAGPRIMEDKTPTDWDGTRVWRAVGVNPMLRFIRYGQDGSLVPHYDSPWIAHEGKRSLMSVLLYIDAGNARGGATRFIRDTQASLPISSRDLTDWSRFAASDDVLLSVLPDPGACLIFDHRILHDSETLTGNTQKIVLRTDIFFERCGPAPACA